MRVLYHHRTQGRGVEAVHISGLCDAFRRLDAEVDVIGPPGIDADPDVVVAAEKGKTGTVWGPIARKAPQFLFELMELGYNLAAAPRVLRLCRKRRPDLIYERYALYNLTGVLVGRLTNTPVIIEVNETVSADRTRAGKSLKMPWLARWFERRIFRGATGLTPVSEHLKNQLIASGVPADRVRVTPNAVDAERFDPSQADGARIRARHGLEDALVVGFVGSFTKWHRVDLLVHAATMLIRDYPQARLLLVGDGALKEETEAQVAQLGLDEHIVFAGKVPHAEIPDYVAAMDIGVMPESNNFGSPMKVFEYMSMGRPAVAPAYGPIVEILEHGRTGMLFDPRDVRKLAACLKTLASDSGLRDSIGRAARKQVLSRHLWTHNACEVLRLARVPGADEITARFAPCESNV